MPQHNRPLIQRSSGIRLNALSKIPQPSLSWRWRSGQARGHLQRGLSPWPCPQAALGDLSWKLFHTTVVSSVLEELSCTSRFCPNMWTPLREPMTENGSWGKIGNLRQEPPSFLLLGNQLLRPPTPFLSGFHTSVTASPAAQLVMLETFEPSSTPVLHPLDAKFPRSHIFFS